MSEQMQCPNCGGYRVNSYVEQKDVETGKLIPVSTGIRVVNFIGLVIWLGVSAATLGLFLLFFLSEKFREELIDVPFKGVRKEREHVTSIHHCTCQICGYEWDWDIRDSKPEVTMRPDLIAKGVKKLEEEEEERRRRADDDWYWRQRQQNEKK